MRVAQQLSRLVGAKETKDPPKPDLKPTVSVEIVIGTHALLAAIRSKFAETSACSLSTRNSVSASNKRKNLKELRGDNVHVLTLTATPIPRTLQMALTGVKRNEPHHHAAGRSPGRAHVRDAVRPRRMVIREATAARTLSVAARASMSARVFRRHRKTVSRACFRKLVPEVKSRHRARPDVAQRRSRRSQ
jgi:hypothetical protein